MRPLFIILSAGDGFHVKHGKSGIDLIHLDRFFSLLQLSDKAKPQPAAGGELLLCQSGGFPVFFDKLGNFIHGTIASFAQINAYFTP